MPSKHTLPRGARRRRTRWSIWELALLATSAVMIGSPLIAAMYAILVPVGVPAQTLTATTTVPRATTDPNPSPTPTTAANTPTALPTTTTAPTTPPVPTNTQAPASGCGTGAYPAPCTPTTVPTIAPTTLPPTTGPTTLPPTTGPTNTAVPTSQPTGALGIGVSALSTSGQSIAMVDPRSVFNYYIRVDHSTASATSVMVTDILPGQVQALGIVNVSGGTCTLAGSTLNCSLTPWNGVPATAMVQVKVVAGTPGTTIVNSATVTDPTSGAHAADNAVVTVSGTAPTATQIPPTATTQAPTATTQPSTATTQPPLPTNISQPTVAPVLPSAPTTPPPSAPRTGRPPHTGVVQPTPTNPVVLPVTVVPATTSPDAALPTAPAASPSTPTHGAPPTMTPRKSAVASTPTTVRSPSTGPTSPPTTDVPAPGRTPTTSTPGPKATHLAAATTAPTAGHTTVPEKAKPAAQAIATREATGTVPTATLAPTLAPVTTPAAGAAGARGAAVRFNLRSDWGQVAAGETVVYTITLQNAGHAAGGSSPLLSQASGHSKLAALDQGAPIADVLVVDRLSESLEPLEVDGSGITAKREGQYVQATRAAIAAGETVTIAIKARVRSNTSLQSILNQASLQYRGHSGTIYSNVSELQIIVKAKAEAPAAKAASGDPASTAAPESRPAGGGPATKSVELGTQLPHTSGGEVPLGGMILLGLTMLLHTVRVHRARVRI